MSENAVVYARYSSRGQNEQSIEGQLAAAQKYADDKGYTIVKTYCDRAKTGTNDRRESFQQMLTDCAKHQFTVIIVWKVDRFGRNRYEIAINKARAKNHGVRVEYVSENISPGPEGVILESVLEGLAEYYSLQLSQNVARGKLESAKKHHVIGGMLPYGFRAAPDKSYEIDPERAAIARQIFERYAKGDTISTLLAWLDESGIRNGRGTKFTKTTLPRMLKDERYIGTYSFKDIIHDEDAIPAIVDKETFKKVQLMMKNNKRMPSHAWDYSTYLLTGKIFCGHCGSMMIGMSGINRHGNKYGYYACADRRKKGGTCKKKNVRQDWIEPLVISEILNLLHDDVLFGQIVDAAWRYYQEEVKAADETAGLRAQLREAERGISNLVRAMEAGAVSEALVIRLQSLEDQKAALNKSIAQAELALGPRLTRERIEFFLLRFRDADPDREEDRKAIVDTFVNAIYLYDDKITITFNYRPDGVNKKQVTLTDLDGDGGSSLDPSIPLRGVRSNIFSIRLFRHVIIVTFTIERR
jgi:DNA invertase Pin-like site-specific DNA recombinase